MKRIFAIIFVLIVLAAFTPLGCFADGEPIGLTCGDFRLIDAAACDSDGNSITFTGSVILDLKGRSLTAKGITCDSGNNCSLTINDTSGGTVTLTETGISVSGDISITGGTVEANGTNYGIYAGNDITISGEQTQVTAKARTVADISHGIWANKVYIKGGKVNATGELNGICSESEHGSVTIEGGEVTATGTSSDGINSGSIDISGKETKVTATGGSTGIIGRVINISDGEVTAIGRVYAISGTNRTDDSSGIDISISISGGTVTAESWAGTGIYTSKGITIIGGTVEVTADDYAYGILSSTGDIAISGGEVTVIKGDVDTGGNITISGGQVSVVHKISAGNIDLGLAGPDDFIHAENYSGTIKATTPLRVFNTEEMTGGPLQTIDAGEPVLADIINSKWLRPLHFTVALDQQGGSGGAESITATYGSAMPTADMPARTGYTFGGYFTEINGSGTQYYDGNGTSTKNWDKTEGGTLYAKWTANAYTAVFEANYPANTADADHSGSMQNQNFTYDEAEKQLTANGFSCVGYTFAGWNTDKNGSGKKYEDQQSVRNLTEEANGAFTLYGQWTAVEYTITIEAAENGRVTSAPSGKAAYGETVTLTAAADAGYVLETLNVKSGDTAVPVTDNKFTMPAGDVTVKASFVPHNHEYSFTASGAELTAECANTDGAHVGELKAALTLIPPEDTVYDGTAKTASVSGMIPDIVTPAIVYRQDGTDLGGAPVNAGTYTAEITLKGAKASVEFTITKRPATVTAIDQSIKKGETIQTGPEWAALEGAVEGNVLSAVTLRTYGTQIRPSDAKIAQGSAQPKGDYTAPYDIDVTDNYDITYVPGTLTIVSDPVSYQVTFRVMNGAWNDGSREDVSVTLSGNEGDTLKLSADQIPGAGSAPDEGFKAGGWDTVPNTNTPLTGNVTYTYSYVPADAPEPEPEPERPGIDFFRLYGNRELPATGFSALRPTVLPDQPKDLRYEPARMSLMLPTLDREIGLVTMPREGNSWAAAWLGADAGILEGSALPGEGLSLIAGHNTLNDTDYGPFALLSTLEVNDTVMVREESGALKLFRVYANELLEPDDMARLAALAGEDALVLLTCENESATGTYLHRRAVFAR